MIYKTTMPFLDALSLTLLEVRTPEAEANLIYFLETFLEAVPHELERGGKGYPQRTAFSLEQASLIVFHGSPRVDMPLHIEAKGDAVKYLINFISNFRPVWRISRADVAVDTTTPFEELHRLGKQYAEKKGITTSLVGDWEGEKNGRTYYIGKRTSETFFRIYEKSVQMKASFIYNRVEVELKPRPIKRDGITKLCPEFILSCFRNPTELFNHFLCDKILPIQVNRNLEKTDFEVIHHCFETYQNRFRDFIHEHGRRAFFDLLERFITKSS